MGEDWDSVKLNMKVIRFSKTSFEHQIFESVLIQENMLHNLLNSKSEYNRCSIPRLTLKMVDRELKSKTIEEELLREESIIEKIRYLKKERNRKRGNQRGNPVRKKIKLDGENDSMSKVMQDCANMAQSSSVKRQNQPAQNLPPSKRQKTILDYIGPFWTTSSSPEYV